MSQETIGNSDSLGCGAPSPTHAWSPPCPRVGKLFGGCKFAPRYDLGEASGAYNLKGGNAASLAYINESLKPKTYVRDVCERCGKTIERGEAK